MHHDQALFTAYKSIYFASSWGNYRAAKKGSLKLSPSLPLHEVLERDYVLMRDMFFGSVPEWGEVLRVIGDFEMEFNEP